MPQVKITLDELQRRLKQSDMTPREMRRFFRTNETTSAAPFKPGITPDPETVDIPANADLGKELEQRLPDDQDAALRSHFGPGDLLIGLQLRERRAQFRQKIRDGYKGPVIVSDGDSWSLHPLLYDIIDYLRTAYAIYSLDRPGDTLDDIVNEREYAEAITEHSADIFLISAGGNDVVGGGALASHLEPFNDSIKDPAKYLKQSYHDLVEECLAKYEKVFEDVRALSATTVIICHGYDRVIPNDGPWLGKPMASIGIKAPELQKKISDVMVEGFNRKLAALAKRYEPRVYYLSLLGSIPEWNDELHPTEAGFRQAASHFRWAIDSLSG